MQTVNFQCGHCGKLMAVSTDYLGRQVRCPHCQKVVVAPAASPPPPAPAPVPVPAPMPAPVPQPQQEWVPPPPPPPVFLDPTVSFDRSESDSIFGPPEQSDDLFDSTHKPRLEMSPPQEVWREPPSPPPTLVEAPVPVQDLLPPGEDLTAPGQYLPGNQAPVPVSEANAETLLLEEQAAPFEEPSDNGIPGLPNDSLSAATSSPSIRRSRQSRQGSTVYWSVLLPLILYAVSATFLLIYLVFFVMKRPHYLLDEIPDMGDTPGVTKGGQRQTWKATDKHVRLPLNPALVKRLGEPITIGALEVTPLKVEQRIVSFSVEKDTVVKSYPCPNPSLVLHLRLRNLADDYSFTPLDNYFDRKPQRGDVKPFTQLEMGSNVFYGGPTTWCPVNRPKESLHDREWIDFKGRKNIDENGLEPGQSMETIVCTDGGESKAIQTAAGFEGTFLWRVQVRRGLVYRNGRDRSASAVLGVQFTRDQIVKIDE